MSTSAILSVFVVFWSLLGRSWRVLSSLDRFLGCLEALLEPPMALWEASWSLLWCSRGRFGVSWALWRPPWRRPNHHKDNMRKTGQLPDPTTQTYRAQMGAFWEPKIDQNRTQNESKIKTMFKSEKNGLQEPLRAVLGRSWGILGGILGLQKSLRYRQA